MGRKRDTTVERDRLRLIVLPLVDGVDLDLNVTRFAGAIGYKPGKKRTSAAQAISRWLYGRWGKVQDPQEGEAQDPQESKKDLIPRPLKSNYRDAVFSYVRENHNEEYRRPLPEGQRWPRPVERERWLEDTRPTDHRRRSSRDLAVFYAYLQSGATIIDVTSDSVRAEVYDNTCLESAQVYSPPGGLIEEDYCRLNTDDLPIDMQRELAWAVIDNILWKKGLLRSQIRRTRHLVAGRADILDLVGAHSFEVVADTLFNELKSKP